MLTITIPEVELYDSKKNEFITIESRKIVLEHSLVSLSKWESKWKKPFLKDSSQLTEEELLSYIQCMTLTQNVPDSAYKCITKQNIDEITAYIKDPMTATWFSEIGGKKSTKIITSELIYYWMIALNVPMECQKWHLNRLLTLIRVCNIENAPKKKMSKRELASRNASLNAERRKKLNTNG